MRTVELAKVAASAEALRLRRVAHLQTHTSYRRDGADTMSRLSSAFRHNILAWLVLALAAVLAALPLLTTGYSCGHDFDFHLRSWLEASTQWRSGILRPVWAFHAGWNAGEPRLLFYPPLSWITGALLTLIVPWSGIVFAFTAVTLLLCGITMRRLLRRWDRWRRWRR